MTFEADSRRGPRVNERLMVLCWCGTNHGFVSPEQIRNGETFSCGPHCTRERYGA